ncbi:hypothetical protein M378DRAFT_192380 [Amanita muscaria Koide BX008]|uniref:Major facilitator superfamily (MFS) profile domain-containing protein n=1 Tax=Amanita muscaria (strain Koide BX008) TaxID=946122 RepID=A0A0C2SQU8_AMAMK|nr:hypothetical protein M378DRAFT_192380 [Amanita muscaria Koide BX008]
MTAASVAGSYTMGFTSMMSDLNCNHLEAISGLSTYALGFAIVPLISASLSEEFGRKPLYNYSGLIFFLMFAMIALAKNVQTVIIGRLLQGMAGSTCATVVGGTIADIWSPKDRGIPMAVFSLAAVGGTGFGPLIGGWIEMNPTLQWRWIQWIQMIGQFVFLLLTLVMRETRPEILLEHRAKQLRKETGDNRYRARVEVERPKLVNLLMVSCARPLYLTFTEPIVTAISLWIGLTWGVIFNFLSTIPLVYQTVHHFNIGLIGTTYVSMIIGAILGFLTILKQQSLYLYVGFQYLDASTLANQRHRQNYSKRGPEARLYAACAAGLMFPAAMFIYAWSTLPQVHWIVPNIGITLLMWAAYIIYQTVFSYLSDCYGTWASSASAGQSLTRNLIATVFPLFATQMFERLSYKWACTLFACLGVIMAPIPFVLFFWGPAIRKRSKVASRLTEI